MIIEYESRKEMLKSLKNEKIKKIEKLTIELEEVKTRSKNIERLLKYYKEELDFIIKLEKLEYAQ